MMRKCLFVLLIAMVGQPSLAWDNLGHQTVAAVALRNLSPKTAARMKAILGSDDFVMSATWADEIKHTKGWSQTPYYHYTSVDDGKSYLDTLAALPPQKQAQGDVLMAILKADNVLRSAGFGAQDKNYAAKFMIHFVGDLFQPLHTGRINDRGGNEIAVSWFGKRMNLHSVWDNGIIAAAYGDKLKSLPPEQQPLYLANYLMQKHPMRVAPSTCAIDVGKWFQDSLQARRNAYTGNPNNSGAYLTANLPVVETQIVKGGVALACTLNIIFDGSTGPTPIEIKTVQLINQAVHGDIFKIISLSTRTPFSLH